MTPRGHVAHMENVSSAYKIFIAVREARKIGYRLEVLKKYTAKMWVKFS
jgi:hypothetical protein